MNVTLEWITNGYILYYDAYELKPGPAQYTYTWTKIGARREYFPTIALAMAKIRECFDMVDPPPQLGGEAGTADTVAP
jgi:hypothetical protein